MSRRPSPLPAPLRGRPFGVAEAERFGVTRVRTRAADLVIPFRGARAPADDPPDVRHRAAALERVLRPGEVLAGPTAAVLWGMPLPAWATDGPLWVASPRAAPAMRRAGVFGVRRTSSRIVVHGGLPLQPPEEAWSSLARLLPDYELAAVADWLVSGTRDVAPLLGRSVLEDELRRSAGGRGVVRLRAALAEAREGAWSRTESLLRIACSRAGLPEPELNVRLVLGGMTLHPDLLWREARVATEYNGSWHDDAARFTRDLRRMDAYRDGGIDVVNVDRTGLFRDPAGEVGRIARRLRVNGWRGALRLDRAALPGLRP